MVEVSDNYPYTGDSRASGLCATPSYTFATVTPLPLHAAFDGGRLTSDGGLSESSAPLASQPTLSRLENAMTRCACYYLAVALVELYLRPLAPAPCIARAMPLQPNPHHMPL